MCVGLIIRITNLKDNILFAYDQARDVQRIYSMVYEHNLKIVGPETDIPGIFNGPLLYYVLAPIYFFSHFSPNAAALFFVLVNVGTIALVYWAADILFQKKSIALFASLIWAISYEQGFFARYISNASPMSTVTTVFFIGLALFFIKKKQWGLPLSALGIALSIHCNFYFIYLFLFYPIFFFIYKQRPTTKTIITSLVIFGILLSPWIITELKWHFVGSRSLLTYFLHQGDTSVSVNVFTRISTLLERYYDRISQAIYYVFIPSRALGFTILFIFGIYIILKKYNKTTFFFIAWFLNTLPLFLFNSGVHSVEVINGSVFVPLSILIGYLVYETAKYRTRHIPIISVFILIFVVIYNIHTYAVNHYIPMSIFTSVPFLLKDSKDVIDYTYKKSGGKEFNICSISEPLFTNTVWGFLYSTYGKDKYGFIPSWTGQSQILNKSFIPYAKRKLPTKFIIREPLWGIPEYAPVTTHYIEDTQNTLIDEKNFGSLNVQQRLFTKENSGDLRKYSRDQIDKLNSVIHAEGRFSCDITYE